MSSFHEYPEETIIKEIQNFVAEETEKQKKKTSGITYYEAPLIGFADANDPGLRTQ